MITIDEKDYSHLMTALKAFRESIDFNKCEIDVGPNRFLVNHPSMLPPPLVELYHLANQLKPCSSASREQYTPNVDYKETHNRQHNYLNEHAETRKDESQNDSRVREPFVFDPDLAQREKLTPIAPLPPDIPRRFESCPQCGSAVETKDFGVQVCTNHDCSWSHNP